MSSIAFKLASTVLVFVLMLLFAWTYNALNGPPLVYAYTLGALCCGVASVVVVKVVEVMWLGASWDLGSRVRILQCGGVSLALLLATGLLVDEARAWRSAEETRARRSAERQQRQTPGTIAYEQQRQTEAGLEVARQVMQQRRQAATRPFDARP